MYFIHQGSMYIQSIQGIRIRCKRLEGSVIVKFAGQLRQWYKYLVLMINNPGEYFYSVKRANHVIEFAENFCRISKGANAGKVVRLELWEKALLAAVFGFIDINGNRMCREALLIVGKKNGKSLIASIVGFFSQNRNILPDYLSSAPNIYTIGISFCIQ